MLNRGPSMLTLQDVKKQLLAKKLVASIQLFSSLNKQGLEDAAVVLGEWLNYPPAPVEIITETDIIIPPELLGS